jgi:ornithine cyclodeaminase/alanine dehydrogenase-like protein (mu-crystallin family)
VATGEEIARLAAVVGRDFEPFRRYCEREALYIVAICQSESKARRAEWEAEQEGAAESARQLAAYTDLVTTTIPATKPVAPTDEP